MEEFTKLMVACIAENLTTDSYDQYNNKIPSPINRFMSQWAESNKKEITEAVGQKMNIQEIARKTADGVIEHITKFGGSYNYDSKLFKEKLDAEVLKQVAERIARTVEIPKSN